MNIVVFDTETTSLEKTFCYNIGYLVYDTDNHEVLLRKDFIVEQVWNNLPLFSSAYYADKRELYVSKMRGRRAVLKKYGYITQEMKRDFEKFNVEYAFAYNAAFDEKVFNFMCDWYKVINPFDNVKIVDIMPFAYNFLCNTESYKQFCEQHQLFTDAGNYSMTAENVYRYVSGNTDFIEEHTALADSDIEAIILMECVHRGAQLTQEYASQRFLERKVIKELIIVANNTETKYKYVKRINRGNKIFLKE